MNAEEYDSLTERLLEEPCYVIDFLPRQVPAECGGQYFAVERFMMEERLAELYGRFAGLMVRLNCYYRMVTGDGDSWSDGLTPAELHARITGCGQTGTCTVLLPEEESLVTLYGGDLYMTVYHPTEELLETARQLAAALGFFVRPGC